MAVVWVGKGETPRNTPRLTGVGSPVYEKTPFSQHTRERRGGARVCERYSYLTNTSGEEGADNLCCCHICARSIPAALHTHPGITASSSPCWSAASSPLQSVKNHPQKTQMLVFLCVHSQCAGRKVLSECHIHLCASNPKSLPVPFPFLIYSKISHSLAHRLWKNRVQCICSLIPPSPTGKGISHV